jgi:hypothetical protein
MDGQKRKELERGDVEYGRVWGLTASLLVSPASALARAAEMVDDADEEGDGAEEVGDELELARMVMVLTSEVEVELGLELKHESAHAAAMLTGDFTHAGASEGLVAWDEIDAGTAEDEAVAKVELMVEEPSLTVLLL